VHEAEQRGIRFDTRAGVLDGAVHQGDIRPATPLRALAR
jgi:hypothetical protein